MWVKDWTIKYNNNVNNIITFSSATSSFYSYRYL